MYLYNIEIWAKGIIPNDQMYVLAKHFRILFNLKKLENSHPVIHFHAYPLLTTLPNTIYR